MLGEKYIAGFLDADGHIGFQFNKDCSRPQMALQFSQKTSQDKVLFLIQEAIGGRTDTVTIKGSSYTRLGIYGRAAEKVLNRIAQHLIIKRHYAYVCLECAGRPYADLATFKAYLKEQRRMRSLPLPNFPPRQWLAGYFDGDGCLSINRVCQSSGVAYPVAHIAASDFDTEGIEILCNAFGGKIYPMCENRVKQWAMQLNPSKAKEFLGYFAKHLVTKKDQADFILGCAAMGNYRDGNAIKAALKQLKAHDHRLSEPDARVSELLSTIRSLPKYERADYGQFVRNARGQLIGKA